MVIISLILIVVGALPLIVFLVKRKSYRNIINKGNPINAVITETRLVRFNKGNTLENIYYVFLPPGSNQYFQGMFSAPVGKHKKGAELQVYYLPGQPQKNAVPGSKGEIIMLLFTIIIFLFMIFASYKIYEILNSPGTNYKFNAPWK
jgi:hypothetical protein